MYDLENLRIWKFTISLGSLLQLRLSLQMLQVLLQAKENLQKALGRDPTKGELAEATKMTTVEVRKHIEVGRAARNKLIKVSTSRSLKLETVFYAALMEKGFFLNT